MNVAELRSLTLQPHPVAQNRGMPHPDYYILNTFAIANRHGYREAAGRACAWLCAPEGAPCGRSNCAEGPIAVASSAAGRGIRLCHHWQTMGIYIHARPFFIEPNCRGSPWGEPAPAYVGPPTATTTVGVFCFFCFPTPSDNGIL